MQTNAVGQLINLPQPEDLWTVPLVSISGSFAPGSLLNVYSDTLQYNYAVKHNGMPFFPDTSGGDNTTPSNPLAGNYAPLQQLASDLANNKVAEYNWITPNQFNEMHSTLKTPFLGLASDASNIYAGDNTVSRSGTHDHGIRRLITDGGVICSVGVDETECL